MTQATPIRIPKIGITAGDPAGIGPEIICRSLTEADVQESCIPVVIGSRSVLEEAIDRIGTGQKIHVITDSGEAEPDPGRIDLIDLPLDYDFQPGVMQTGNGKAAISYMEKAYELIAAGKLDGTASAPCNKEAMRAAGLPCAGATEFYARLAGVAKSYAVIDQAGFYVFQATSHMALTAAIERITENFLKDTIITAFHTLQQWGIASPRLALSGFNPHAGDGGAMGREDEEILAPAIRAASTELGVPIAGPIPADALYIKGLQGVYDGVIFLFHDTANIAVKLMETTYPSVVITGGLPFIRTTVAHGTAYDIAYQGIAGHRQMKNAILAAARIGSRLMSEKL